LLVLAWVITLAGSLLPDIHFRELTGSSPPWLFWYKVTILGGLLLTSLVWKTIRPLKQFFTVVLVVYLVEWGVGMAYQGLNNTAWFARADPFIQ